MPVKTDDLQKWDMSISSKKILVIGGAGFIGSHLVDELIKKDHDVVVVDNLSSGRKENLNSLAKFYKIDIKDINIFKVFEKEKPEIVFHFAAKTGVRESIEKPLENADTNILGTLNVLESCRKVSVKKIIFASSGGAIYNPNGKLPFEESSSELPFSPYGVAKLSGEKYLDYYQNIFGLDYVSLRFANIYGPRQSFCGESGVISIFCAKMLSKKQPVIYGDGEQTRDFVYVKDAVRACIMAAKESVTGVFNVGTAKETSINEIFDIIKKIVRSDFKKKYNLENSEWVRRSCLSYNKIKKVLNWMPEYELDRGINETLLSWK